jgi:hypothetical protein
MENMNTNISVTHLEHPEDEKILGLLEEFEKNSEQGFLRLAESDRVFVVLDSEAHQKLQGEVSNGKAFSLGTIEHKGQRFCEYAVNESFFKS